MRNKVKNIIFATHALDDGHNNDGDENVAANDSGDVSHFVMTLADESLPLNDCDTDESDSCAGDSDAPGKAFHSRRTVSGTADGVTTWSWQSSWGRAETVLSPARDRDDRATGCEIVSLTDDGSGFRITGSPFLDSGVAFLPMLTMRQFTPLSLHTAHRQRVPLASSTVARESLRRR